MDTNTMSINTKDSTVVNYHVIMAVYIEDNDYYYKTFGRKYYLVEYENKTQKIFLTTNELMDGYEKFELDDDYILITDLYHMLADFETSGLIGLLIESDFDTPPKYIYYDIITIHESIKPFVLNHLKKSISHFTDLDLSNMEKAQINKWITYLSA